MTDDTLPLRDCPIGLFTAESGELCLKTKYGNNEGRIDAYIVSSGEFFWGAAPQTIASQRMQMVRPVDVDIIPLVRCRPCDGSGSDAEGEHCPTCEGHGWVRLGPLHSPGTADLVGVPKATE